MTSMAQLRRCLLMRQDVAGFGSATGVEGFLAFIDALNDPLLIDHEGGAIAEPLIFVKDSIVLHYSSFEIA